MERSSDTHSQEDLQRGVSHLDELEIHQTARYRNISVVLRCPRGGRTDGRHPAPWTVLHPPGAMHGQIEGQDKVRILREKKRTQFDEKYHVILAWDVFGFFSPPVLKIDLRLRLCFQSSGIIQIRSEHSHGWWERESCWEMRDSVLVLQAQMMMKRGRGDDHPQ